MAFEDYTIKQFMKAWFKEDYSEISQSEFKLVYDEYIDASGLFVSEDFDKVSYVNFLLNRINSVKIFLELQIKYLEEFEVPNVEKFSFLKKFGYSLKWNNSCKDFRNQIESIKSKEIKYVTKLNSSIKEIEEKKEKDKANKKEPSKKDSRNSFIRMLNSLGKNGFRIDNEKTTVEELALMIKQQIEEIEILKSK